MPDVDAGTLVMLRIAERLGIFEKSARLWNRLAVFLDWAAPGIAFCGSLAILAVRVPAEPALRDCSDQTKVPAVIAGAIVTLLTTLRSTLKPSDRARIAEAYHRIWARGVRGAVEVGRSRP